jgi:hypothetical protein
MRNLIIKPNAEQSIYDVAEWIAEKNFPESGIKFIETVEAFLFDYCKLTNLKFPLCKNKKLAAQKLSCVIFNQKWVVAFKYTTTTITVYEFVWGGKLT